MSVPGDAVGKWQPRVPRWRATLLASWQLSPALSLSYGARYSGRQFSTLDNSDPNGFAYQAASKYFTTDLRAQWQRAEDAIAQSQGRVPVRPAWVDPVTRSEASVMIEKGTAMMSPVCQPRPIVQARKVASPPSIATLTALFQPSAPMMMAGEKPANTIRATEIAMDLVLANLAEFMGTSEQAGSHSTIARAVCSVRISRWEMLNLLLPVPALELGRA